MRIPSQEKKVFFASDFHLGAPDFNSSLVREKRIVEWLESIRHEASDIYLVGDLFDFWFEYKHVVPKGFTRLLGKLCSLQDSGVQIHIFHGNHDLWQFGYLEKEIGCTVYDKPVIREIGGKTFYIAHGDGLGPGQTYFKLVLSLYRNRLCQRLLGALHPRWGMAMGHFFSRNSKQQKHTRNTRYLGDEKEYLVQFATNVLTNQHIDYFIFGHRHLPFSVPIVDSSVINLGDWITHFSFAVFDGTSVELSFFKS